MNADLVITNIGQLVTCASPDGPKRGDAMRDVGMIGNGAIAVAEGKIIAVGSAGEIGRDYQARNVRDVGGRVVAPGFVDPHTHIVFGGDRLDEFELKIKGAEYLDILASGGGIISTVRKTREASVADLVESTLNRLDKMLALGTTTCEIKTGYGLDTATELKMLEVIEQLDAKHPIDIVPTFLGAHAVPPEFKDRADAYVNLICDEMLPAASEWYRDSSFAERSVPFFCDVFVEKNAFSVEQSKQIFERASQLGLTPKAHVDEFTNLGGAREALRWASTSIDHLDAISDEEIRLLARSDTIGIITPTVNFNFGSREFADARKLIDAGCAIALSTDYNPGSAPCPSQMMVMAIACRYQKLLPAEAYNAATINAAHGIGMPGQVGSIEVGKNADLVLLDSDDYRLATYEFGGNLVSTVFKEGNLVYEQE